MVQIRRIWGLLVVLSLNYAGLVDSENWIDGVTRNVVENWGVDYVMMIEQLVKNESSFKNRQVDDFRLRLMQTVATITCRIVVGNMRRDSSMNCVSNEIGGRGPLRVGSTTLYAIISDVSSNYGPLKSTIESLAALSEWKSEKMLLLLISSKPRKKLKKLLEFAWSKKLLDFTIIELFDPLNSIPARRLPAVIHRYNPFKKEYGRREWSSDESFFLNEATLDMWGYPLRIGILHEPPMSFVKFNESNKRPISMKGANINLVKLMAERLNFTAIWIPFNQFPEIMQDRTPSGLYKLMNSDKIDLLASVSPHHSNSKEYRIERTTSVLVDRMCPVVPITRSVQIVLGVADVIRLYAVISIILIGFWVPIYLLKFHDRNWKLINIFKLFLGFGWATTPKNNAERVLFASILFLSVIYFNVIFASSAETRFVYDEAASIKTFRELDDSGLTPMVSSFLYNKTFARSEAFLPNLKKKSISVYNIDKCPLYAVKHKNVCCIMGERDMLLTMEGNENYRHRLKIVRPCFWFDTYGFLLGKASPYVRYINTVISAAHTAGFISKWYSTLDDIRSEDWLAGGDLDKADDNTPRIYDRDNSSSPTLLRQLIIIFTIGFVASLLIFIGEMIVHRVIALSSPISCLFQR